VQSVLCRTAPSAQHVHHRGIDQPAIPNSRSRNRKQPNAAYCLTRGEVLVEG
jgi:hypothetical protein